MTSPPVSPTRREAAGFKDSQPVLSQSQGKGGSLSARPDISVIICTYNRCELLQGTIESLLSQDCAGLRYELLIVDNHSTDATRQICEAFVARQGIALRYLFEPEQGVSFARNTGIREARAPILAFSDDDVCVSRGWLTAIKRAFDEHKEIAGVGGKVLPLWQQAAPLWLTRRHWMPLALQDYGDAPLRVDGENPLCLITANLALRRQVFERIGLFSPTLQRVKNGIGSMEDHELHTRLWNAGYQEMYIPEVVVGAVVQPERLTREYHRRWHKGHGHFYALMRDPEFERSAARLFDVPAHLYKQAFFDVLRWSANRLSRNRQEAYARESNLCFFIGFLQQRLATLRRSENSPVLRRLAAFLRSASDTR
jgi:glycosyltransferase involved in cell wall biosynthesis